MQSKIGSNTNIDTTDFVPLSNAVVINPSGEQVSIVSDSGSDTLLGSNVQKVRLRYLDTTFVPKEEIISMAGTTPVLSVATNVLRIESFEVFKLGPTYFGSAGTITVTDVATGLNLYAQIDPTYNRFQRAVHFVPPGTTSFLTDISMNCTTSGGVIFVVFIAEDNTNQGGSVVLKSDSAYALANESAYIQINPLSQQIICDATQSNVALAIGIAVKGITSGQSGLVTFHYYDIIYNK